jgi:hypothetical protein
MVIMTQGEQRTIIFNLRQDGETLRPEMIQDLKVCTGNVRKKYSDGAVAFLENKWNFKMSQKDTFSMEPGNYDLVIHIKYPNDDILIRTISMLVIKKGCCKEKF